jgi:chitin disaccharide deacetylase
VTRTPVRWLIVNADDLGYSSGITRGILEAHERGIVTSASMMVGEPGAEEAAEAARDAPALSVGLHAVLEAGGEIAAPDEAERELERQLVRFERLVGRRPTHLDSHHHVHRDPRLRPVVEQFAARHGLPLRDRDAAHCGEFYGRWDGESHLDQVGVGSLLEILARLQADVTELGCHPGYADGLRSSYTVEREHELRTLTDPRVRARVEELGIELIGWGYVA